MKGRVKRGETLAFVSSTRFNACVVEELGFSERHGGTGGAVEGLGKKGVLCVLLRCLRTGALEAVGGSLFLSAIVDTPLRTLVSLEVGRGIQREVDVVFLFEKATPGKEKQL
jgi:hypothetical protein